MFTLKTLKLFLFLICLSLPIFGQEVDMQQVNAKARNGNHLYLKLSGGITLYGGDTDNNPENDIQQYLEDKGIAGRLELGKEISQKSDMGVALTYGNYTAIEPNEIQAEGTPDFEDTSRFRAELLYRYHPIGRKKIDPFVQVGANITSGHVYKRVLQGKKEDYQQSRKIGYGPTFGGGVAVKLTDALSLNLETSQNVVFPDIAADGANYQSQLNSGGDTTAYDWLSYYGAGISLSLGQNSKTATCVMPKIKAADYSGITEAGQALTFTTLIDETAEIVWDFGDGSTAMGNNAMHQYANPGDYNVTVTAMNTCGVDTTIIPITIGQNQQCTDIEVVAISASKFTATVNENIQFYASVSGSADATYKWTFGDGAMADVRTATHSYTQPGTYQVDFTATNSCEVENKSIQIQVKAATVTPVVNAACLQVSQLNAVYFDYGSTALDTRAKAKLDENIDLLKTCATAKVRINGYTDTVEQNAIISATRAKNVQNYYQQNGISIEYLMIEDKGQAPISCDKEDPGIGCRRNRRAESIPVLN